MCSRGDLPQHPGKDQVRDPTSAQLAAASTTIIPHQSVPSERLQEFQNCSAAMVQQKMFMTSITMQPA